MVQIMVRFSFRVNLKAGFWFKLERALGCGKGKSRVSVRVTFEVGYEIGLG